MKQEWATIIIAAFGSLGAVTGLVTVFLNRNNSKDERAFTTVEATVGRLEKTVKELQKEVNKLKGELENKNELILELRKQNTFLELQIADKKEEVDDLREEIKLLKGGT
ncbi:hypothetical protein JZO81_19460 [Enterococcus hulanensis]|uniref:hypothetical protein n=1 Tax=Enterococcus TaxID=1350 RepID=UPI000B5A75DC|nr:MULTISPECIES: hypothetical protein [Enterococcus]MBO0413239.1 hypothetical protein [Enterococcus hulanensis]OTO15092.1 hypothetical protein A5875_004249 [Enterococcus sp. 3H8_DIV0648]